MNRTWGDPVVSSTKSRLEIPGYQLQALAAALVRQGANERVHPRYRQAKETKCGEKGSRKSQCLIVPSKQGNTSQWTLWREAWHRLWHRFWET
jgi:hypothetical protein